MSEKTPVEGDRYVKRAAPDEGRIVTVSRVWTAEDGHTAVAYDWRDDKPGQSFSACSLTVFHRKYLPEGAGVSAREELFNELRQWMHEGEARELINAYAHELAEKVMALRANVPDLKARQLFKDGYDAALMVAALEIDPEVSSGS